MSEKKLEKEFEVYKELATQDKKIDVAALMINALQKHETNLTPDRQKRWAYLISLAFPPFGLLFAIKFYFSDKDDAKHVALLCVVLTCVSILLLVIFTKVLFSGTGASLEQIQQIKPDDIRSLLE